MVVALHGLSITVPSWSCIILLGYASLGFRVKVRI